MRVRSVRQFASATYPAALLLFASAAGATLAATTTQTLPGTATTAAPDVSAAIVAGTGEGAGAVRVATANGDILLGLPFGPAFAGGVRVATGDVNGDGALDVITGSGVGTAQVRVYSGSDAAVLLDLLPFGPGFTGGVYVAAGDLDADGRDDLIVGAGVGSGLVRAFSGVDGHELGAGLPFGAEYGGGIAVAAGDLNADGRVDVIVSTASGGYVRAFSGADLAPLGGGFPYGALFTGGIFVAAGDVNADGHDDVIVAPMKGAAPVHVFSGADVSLLATVTPFAGVDGVSVAAGDVDNDGRADLVVGAGPGGAPHVKVMSGADGSLLLEAFAFDAAFRGGVFVAAPTRAALRFTSPPSAAFRAGTADIFEVRTTGGAGVMLSVNGALPSGLTFTDHADGTGHLGGTPAASTGGQYAVQLRAARGSTVVAAQDFTLTVNETPSFTSAAAATFLTGTAGSFTVATTGFPVPALSLGGAALPSGVTFVDNGDGTARISGTPAAGTAGTYAVTVTAANGIGAPVVQTFTLTVTGIAFTSPDSTTFAVGQPGSFMVTTAATPAVTSLTRLGAALPAGVTFVDNGNGTATLAGQPDAGTGGYYSFTLTASNGAETATQAFTLLVQQPAAITSGIAATFLAGAPASFTVTATGFPAPALTLGGGATLPAGLQFADHGNGTATLSGTADAGTGGAYALSLMAANGVGAAATQNFTLTVNEAPAITSAPAATFVTGTAAAFTVTAHGFPAPAIAIGGVALPASLGFVDHGDGTGTLSGIAVPGSGGSYAITFTASNGIGANAVQTFTLNITQAPAITSADHVTFTVGTAASFTVTTTGFPEPTLSQSGTLPAGVSFTAANGLLGGVPTETGTFGAVQFTAANGVAPDAVQAFTLTVACPVVTVSPSSMADGLYHAPYGPVSFTASGSTGSSLTWSASGLPGGLVIDPDTGVLSGSPVTTLLNAPVAITVTDNFGCQAAANLTLSVRPAADDETYSNGVGNTQYVVGATPPATPHVLVADSVLNGDEGPGPLTAGPPLITTANSGSVALAANGTFVYTPAVGFAGASDTFSYTLTDGNGITNTATVTINQSGMVWYVNNSGANGDGRSHSPFNTLAGAATASAANSTIYVHTGSGPLSGSVMLDVNQALHGQGALLTLNGLTIAPGTRPTLTGTVTLASNTTVVGVNFSGASPALSGAGVTGAVAIDQVAVTGGTTALSLVAVSGPVTVSNASFTNTTGAEVLIVGGTGAVTIGAAISSNAGRSIDIQNRSAGTVTIAGSVVDVAQGLFLNNNTGSTVSFTGGLSLNTGANAAFTATGGGTVTATQNNTTIVNTIVTTTGTPLTVQNTTIGAAGLTFRSISANGAANGIVLSNTGAAGGLTVTGNGGTCTLASPATCTGGRIQNTTGVGIALTSTSAPSFARINVTGSAAEGMLLTSTTNGLTLANSVISANGDLVGYNTTGENNLELTGAAGTVTISGTVLTAGYGGNLAVNNTGSQALTLNVSNSTIQNSVGNATAISSCSSGCEGIGMELTGTTITTLNVQSSSFAGNAGNNVEVRVKQNAVLTASISGNAFSGQNNPNASVLGGGIVLAGLGDPTLAATFEGTMTYTIANNTFDRMHISPIAVNLSPLYFSGVFVQGHGDAVGTISGNVIGTSGVQHSGSVTGHGIALDSRGGSGSVHTVLVTNNQIFGYNNSNGINLTVGESGSASQTNLTVTDNTLGTPGQFTTNGLHVNSGTTSTSADQVCVDIRDNSLAGSGLNSAPGVDTDFRLRQRQLTTVRLPGYGGTSTDLAAVVAFVQGNNPGVETGSAAVAATGGGFVGGGSCTVPTP